MLDYGTHMWDCISTLVRSTDANAQTMASVRGFMGSYHKALAQFESSMLYAVRRLRQDLHSDAVSAQAAHGAKEAYQAARKREAAPYTYVT